MNKYISNLAPLIIDFIEFKNALGIEYKTGKHFLKQLDVYNYDHNNQRLFTTQIMSNEVKEYLT